MKIKRRYIYLIFLPIFLNQIINFINNDQFLNIRPNNIISLVSTFLLFSFLYVAGKIIQDTFSFSTISISIIFYLFSFFIVDSIVLFFYKGLLFGETFLLVNVIWIFSILYKTKKVLLTVFPLIFYFVLNTYNNFYFNTFSKNENLLGDVEVIFFPHTKAIYETSYYFSMANPAMSGYPQFLSYIDALLFKFSFNGDFYTYMTQTSNVFIFLTFLFFFEIKLSTLSKFFSSLLFLSLVSNSEWLKFLFSSSLMSERIVSFTFAVLLYSIFQKSNTNIKYVEFFLFGMLIFSKQFISTVALILLIVLIGSVKYRKYIIFGLFPVVIRELSFLTYFSQLEKDHHIRQIDVQDTIFDILLLRDLDFLNIYKIFKNLFVDKPLFYLIILILFLTLINIRNQYYKKLDFQIYLFSLLLNIILIFLLYISVWKNMELESPIRYILNMLHLKIVVAFLLVDSFDQ